MLTIHTVFLIRAHNTPFFKPSIFVTRSLMTLCLSSSWKQTPHLLQFFSIQGLLQSEAFRRPLLFKHLLNLLSLLFWFWQALASITLSKNLLAGRKSCQSEHNAKILKKMLHYFHFGKILFLLEMNDQKTIIGPSNLAQRSHPGFGLYHSSILAFYLAFYSGIISAIYFGILFSYLIWHMVWHSILIFYLAFYSGIIYNINFGILFWHFIWYIYWHSILAFYLAFHSDILFDIYLYIYFLAFFSGIWSNI